MSIVNTQLEKTMLKKIVLALGTTAAALAVSSNALADYRGGRDWDNGRYEHRWHGGYRHHYYYAPRPVYVVPAPRVVYAPPPPVVYPYYAAPVVVHPAPVYPAAPGVSIRFSFPL
jgi:hypothetical protein